MATENRPEIQSEKPKIPQWVLDSLESAGFTERDDDGNIINVEEASITDALEWQRHKLISHYQKFGRRN